MKSTLKKISLLLFASALVFTSCRTEEIEEINTPSTEVIGLNSKISTLIQQTTTNDGSYDNIIDGASCFDVQLPVTVIANGTEVVINTEEDLDIIEDIFDEQTSDTDTLVIQFPITIILEDYTTVVINSQEELNAAAIQCPGENEEDDDIECIDFQYPITAAIYDANNELIDTVTVNDDEELYDLIDEIDEDLIIAFNFPITVILSDGTTVVINDLDELEDVIENAEDDCDEDDDNDPNDDDCEDCTVAELEELLIGCNPWYVDKLEIDDEDLEDEYDGYLFHFLEEGVLVAEDSSGGETTGTWEANGTGNQIIVSLSITDLSDFNADWNLHEVEEENGGWSVDLRLGDNRLEFRSNCSGGGGGGGGGDDTELVAALTNGDWYVNYFFDDEDETADFADYVLNFSSDGSTTAMNSSGTTNGTWSTSAGDETDLELNLNYGTIPPLDELAEDWDVLEATQDIIRLKDISGGDGSEDFLTFGREPYSGGGGTSDLADILADGTWIVASYLDDGVDETVDFAGYNIVFNSNGTVSASNGSNTNSGIWEVLNSGNDLFLDFNLDIPFEEFNDDWDVIDVTETRVELQDISGGGGGTDNLVFEKL